MLLDARGRPLEMRKAVATPSAVARPSIYTDSILQGLDMGRLARVLRQGEAGDTFGILTLAGEVERRDLHYGSVLGTRKLAVQKLPRRVLAASDSARDVEIADAARALVETDHVDHLVEEMTGALATGVSISEVIWDRWEPVATVPVDLRWFSWTRQDPTDPTHGRVPYMKTERAPTFGEPLQGRGKWIIHRARLRSGLPFLDGLMWPVVVAFTLKNFGLRDWLQYAEVFGLPVRVGKYPAGATPKDVATLRRAVQSIGSDAGAIMPKEMDLEFLGVAGGADGSRLFQSLCEWLDKQISKGVLGQTMTVEDGSSLAQANVHENVRQDLIESDGKKIASTLTTQLIRPYIDYNFGPQKVYPRLVLGEEKQEDRELLGKVLPQFIDRGLTISVAELRDKLGFAEPDPEEEVLGATPDPEEPDPEEDVETNARREELLESALDDLDGDWRPIMDPVYTAIRLAHEESTTPEEFQANAARRIAALPADRLQATVARLDFVARAVGDATDRI